MKKLRIHNVHPEKGRVRVNGVFVELPHDCDEDAQIMISVGAHASVVVPNASLVIEDLGEEAVK